MKLAVSGVGFLLVSLLLATPAAAAPPGASATATAHALAELANCRAQHRPDCPTDTPTPALTATPRLTELPSPTDTPAPASTDTPASTPSDPPLPVPNTDQATPAYVRPTPRDPSGTWLELAVPQGRWAVLYDTSLCAAPVPWTNVWLAVDEQSNRPITVDRDDGGMCAVAAWSWSSDVPCAVDGQGTCDVEMDGAYWDAIAQAEPAATDTPVPVPIDTQAPPSPAPSATPGAQAPRAGIAQAPRAPLPSARVVYVEVTPPPTEVPSSPETAALRMPTVTPAPAAAASPTGAATETETPTTVPTVPSAVVGVISTPAATATSEAAASVAAEASAAADTAAIPAPPADRSPYLVVAMVALIIGAFWVLIGRRAGRPG